MDLSRYAIHGSFPSRIERPTTTDALARTIRAAHDAREALVLWGGGTRIAVGEQPTRYDAAVDMTGLTGIVEHSPADLVCTVRAGTTIAELAASLAGSGQRWPVDVAYPERATVGGVIASAEPSASRLRFQHPRDWIIGCTAVLGDGTVARAGGRVVKNVTGYDLTRLYSGSYGTLAALADVSLKLVAVDEASLTLTLTDEPARLREVALRVRGALPVDAIVLVLGLPREPVLHVRIAGAAATVERMQREVVRIAGFTVSDGDPIARVAQGIASATLAVRVATAPGHEADTTDGALTAYVGTGVAYTGGSVDSIPPRRASAEAAGGALVLERAPLELKRAVGVWGRSPAPSSIARALKTRFDPREVLAPGRMPA